MSREWVDDRVAPPLYGPDTRDKRWVMRCDTIQPSGQRCPTEGAPSVTQPDLEPYVRSGWFIGKVYGDMCPACLTAGLIPSAAPHALMADVDDAA